MKKIVNGLALGTALLFSTASFADFNICNKSDEAEVFVAFGYHDNLGISTQGWYKLEKGDCGKVYEGDLTKLESNLFYIYGMSSNQKLEWKGATDLCVKIPGPFEYKNADKSCESGEKRKFRRFTSDDQKNFTVSLGKKKAGFAGGSNDQGIVTFGSDMANDDIQGLDAESLILD